MANVARQKVEAFSRFKAGQHAINGGDGFECTSLVEAALAYAGAKSINDFKQPASGDYIWGAKLTTLDHLLAGDILQFRNYTLNLRTDLSVGSWQTSSSSRAHHSAIVTRIIQKGVSVEVIEQNVDPDHTKIYANTIYLKSTVFHATLTAVTHVTVSGQIWGYNPQPK